MKKLNNIKLASLMKGGLTVFVSVIIISAVVKAGSLTPTADPAATSYTLTDIYNKLSTNVTATEGDHVFVPGASPAGTLYTLTQIYNAVPTIVANTVKLGTSYLGVAGSLTPDGGTAGVADLFNSETANLTSDWSLDTGTLNLACNTVTFDGTGNLVSTAYDGAGDGTNRWCVTDTGDAIAGEILSGKKVWVDGIEITGSLATQTLSVDNDTVNAGNYTATTLSAVDTDLATGNIKSGVNIFGIDGDGNVVDTSSGDAVVADLFNSKIAWVDGSSVVGTLNLACNTATFNGTGNIVANTYDGAGDGTNRWCMTDTGDVTASQMKTGTIAWVDGLAITGSGTQTLSDSTTTLGAGYYDATTLDAVDTDLIAGNILSGKTIFGINGSVSAGYTYGDASQAQVLTTATGAGTYDASSLSVGTVKSGTSFGVSSTGDYPSDSYLLPSADATADLAASAENITSSNGAVEWWQPNGTRQTATLDFPTLSNICSTDTSNNSAGTLTVTASTIGVGNTYCGTAGTLLASLNNGSATSGDYPQSVGGVDDYNNNGTMPSDSYTATWTTCDAGNSYCQTSDATNADKKDESTGLVWSIWLAGGATSNWFSANNCAYPNGLPGDDGVCGTNGEVACKCVKLTSSKTGCEALGDGNWRLPSQKELMQAYINGSWGNLSSAGNPYWSATTTSTYTYHAWYTALDAGLTSNTNKTNLIRARCVR